MTFYFRNKILKLSALMLGIAALGFAVSLGLGNAWASVETYTNEALEPVPPELAQVRPIAPGELSINDVIKAHNLQKKNAAAQQAITPPPRPATAPLLKAAKTNSADGSSASVMMMQGLRSALQQTDASTVPTLRPPVIKPRSAESDASAAQQTAAASPAPLAPKAADALAFQPGQAPKSLSAGTTATTETVPANDETPAPPAETPAEKPAAVASGCEPHVTSWVKTCTEAGYPANFTGEVRGETRTTCPDSDLHNVFMSNTCVSPDASASDNEPLSAPDSVAPTASMQVAEETAPAPAATLAVKANATDSGDASCGAANGLAADAAPNGDLCNAGSSSEVTGVGPWRWSCKSTHGITVSCAAPVAPHTATASAPAAALHAAKATEDGQCGASHETASEHAPVADLCSKGVASNVNGEGPWTWACSGINGGQAVSCSASRKIDGACGAASGAATDDRPSSDLCNAGYASAVTGNGPWNWTCSGLYGGQATTCSAAPRQDAVCGNASLKGHRNAPRDELCSVGSASSVSGNGPWSWSCGGGNGGSSVACDAPMAVSGACGAANGVPASETPSDNLCRNGSATRVTGIGPWQWNCTGIDGGDTEGCTAPVASSASPVAAVSAPESKTANDLCGAAADQALLSESESDLCKAGTASSVNGDGPWTWTCTDAGHKSSCSTLSPGSSAPLEAKAQPQPHNVKTAHTLTPVAAPAPVEEKAACGDAAGQNLTDEPTDGLCAVGKAGKVRGAGPWAWTCTLKKHVATCRAAKKIDGYCGAANGSVQREPPASGLCRSGTPTDIHGNGPWLWSCVGAGNGASVSCSAQAQSMTRVDGVCGAASSNTAAQAPSVNLCDSGTASNVYGEGPWTWTCSGMNGGIASSCSAQRSIPPAPPPPGPAVDGLCGAANGVAMNMQPLDNLCTGGTTTAVSGQGPWNWNCLGQNGGMTVSCTAPLQPPAPITGSCGASSGVPTLTAPRGGLCSAGISSAVSGSGPWTWSCSGTNGGGAVGCVAPLSGTNTGMGLPSLTATPTSSEAPAPQSAPSASIRSTGTLVTPRLPSGSLPPLQTGSLPSLTPSAAFSRPPEPSAMPPVPLQDQGNLSAPADTPDVPAGTMPLTPPPVRDTLPPSAATHPIGFDHQGNLIAGNHFKLDDDISTIPFARGSENFSVDVTQMLDKLANTLEANGNVRVTLTAFAEVTEQTTPRDARRLSLSRALAIRDYLTTKGISSARIDVRALGANAPSGDPNRVDIKAN